MQSSRRIPRFVARVDRLEGEIRRIEARADLDEQSRRIVEHCIIRLQVETETYIRNYIFDSATGLHFSNLSPMGSNLAHSFRSREAACHFLLGLGRSQREPNWSIPNEAISAARKLNLKNLGHIAAELGVTPWELDDLRLVRNFIAHSSKESALRLRGIGLAPGNSQIDPVSIALSPSNMGGKTYERWAGFVKGVARRLAA